MIYKENYKKNNERNYNQETTKRYIISKKLKQADWNAPGLLR